MGSLISFDFLSIGGTAADQLQGALDYWRKTFASIFDVLTTSPDEFYGGGMWESVTKIIETLQATGIALLIVFFLYGLIKTTTSFQRDLHPKRVAMLFVRFLFAKFIVTYGMDILLKILSFAQGIIKSIEIGNPTLALTLPEKLKTALDGADLWAGIGAFVAAIVGTLVIYVLAIVIIVVVYGRFFKIFMLAAVSPLPLAGFASEATESIGMNFTKSFIGECLRGVLILVGCIIFSSFAASPPDVSAGTTAGSMTWLYVAGVAMNMLILVITIKTSDRIMKEIFGL